MIKAEVEVCAKITRAAVVKESSNGTTFLSFGITIPIKGRDGNKKDLFISVSTDGGKAEKSAFVENRRVKILGHLLVRKKAGAIYYNLRADGGCEIVKSSEDDCLEGTLEFRGKIGKKGVEVRTDKKGGKYKLFSAFSSEKDGDNVEFIWVNFLYFNPKEDEPFLAANKYVKISGPLQIGVFHDDISLECQVSCAEEWTLSEKA